MAKRKIQLDQTIKSKGGKKAAKDTESVNKALKRSTLEANKAKRAQEGVAKQSLSTSKAFSKQQQGLGGLVRAYATIAAHVFALTQVFQILRDAADFYSMQKAAEDMSRVTGVNMMRLARDVQAATGHNLALKDSLESVNKTLAAGATPTQAKELALLAAKISQTFGGSVEANINKINSAVLRGRTELLATLGVVIDTQQVYRDYAAQLGKTANELTIYEKKQATINAIQKEGAKLLGDVKLDRNPYLALLTTLRDVADEWLQVANKVGTAFVEIINESKRFAAALIATLGAVFARKLTPDAATYQAKAIAAFKNIEVQAVRTAKKTTAAQIRVNDSRKKNLDLALKGARKEAASRITSLAKTESEVNKFSEKTRSLFNRVAQEGSTAFKNMGKQMTRELQVVQAQITKTLNQRARIAAGQPVKPLRGVSSGFINAETSSLRATQDALDRVINKKRKLGRETKVLEGHVNGLLLKYTRFKGAVREGTALTTRLTAAQRILVGRMIEQRGVLLSIVPAFAAVNTRIKRTTALMGGASVAFKAYARAAGYAATATRLFAAAINKTIPILTTLWLIFEVGKSLYDKFIKSRDEDAKSIKEANERYEEFNSILDDNVKKLANLRRLQNEVFSGRKTQANLSTFFLNFSNTLFSGLEGLLAPLVGPKIEPFLDTENLDTQIDELEKRLKTASRTILGLSLGPGGIKDDGLDIKVRSEALSEAETKAIQLQEELDKLTLTREIKIITRDLVTNSPGLQGVLATIESVEQLGQAGILAGFNINTSEITSNLHGVGKEIHDLIKAARDGTGDLEAVRDALKKYQNIKIDPKELGLDDVLTASRKLEIQVQSITGSMSSINEQFVRSVGAAAKLREELTNLTINPELTRATSGLIKDFKNLIQSDAAGILSEDGLLRFLNTDILSKTNEQLQAIFDLSKSEIESLIKSSDSAREAVQKLLNVLKDKQIDLFASAAGKLLDMQAKIAQETSKSMEELSKYAPDYTSLITMTSIAEKENIRSAELRLSAAKKYLQAQETTYKTIVRGGTAQEEEKEYLLAKLDVARQAVNEAEHNLALSKKEQRVLRTRLDYEEKLNRLEIERVEAKLKGLGYDKNSYINLVKQAEIGKKILDYELYKLDLDERLLEIEVTRAKELLDRKIFSQAEVTALETQLEAIKAQKRETQLRLGLEQRLLDVRARGDRYNPIPKDLRQFGADLHTIMENEALNFAKGMKTAAEEWAEIIQKTTDSFTDSIVDDLIEGNVDIVEAVKATARTAIGDVAKKNLQGLTRNLFAGLFGKEGKGEATQEKALRSLEEKIIKEAARNATEQAIATEEAVKNRALTEAEKEAAAARAEREFTYLQTAEGRDLEKVRYLTSAAGSLNSLVLCCQSNKAYMASMIAKQTTTNAHLTGIYKELQRMAACSCASAGDGGGEDWMKYAKAAVQVVGAYYGAPTMAQGGVVTKDTVVNIGEAGQSEAVIPLANNREVPVRMDSPSPSVNVTNNYDFREANPQSELRIRQQMEQLRKQTIAAVTQELNRGGSFAKKAGRR